MRTWFPLARPMVTAGPCSGTSCRRTPRQVNTSFAIPSSWSIWDCRSSVAPGPTAESRQASRGERTREPGGYRSTTPFTIEPRLRLPGPQEPPPEAVPPLLVRLPHLAEPDQEGGDVIPPAPGVGQLHQGLTSLFQVLPGLDECFQDEGLRHHVREAIR